MAPVGSYESLNAAIAAGADSVYFGVEQLNMRAASSVNFTLDDLSEIVRTAHAAGVKTYLTVNIVIYDTEMEVMRRIIDRAKADGIDAIIATDLAAILYAREVGMEVHISTQSNISNITAVEFFSPAGPQMLRSLICSEIAAICSNESSRANTTTSAHCEKNSTAVMFEMLLCVEICTSIPTSRA